MGEKDITNLWRSSIFGEEFHDETSKADSNGRLTTFAGKDVPRMEEQNHEEYNWEP
jgi:hypothetical protein